ncbi:MAG: hypothetical protein WCR36_07360 [Bacteroidaceae bacterium]
MQRSNLFGFLLFVSLACFSSGVQAQNPFDIKIDAKIDSLRILIGQQAHITLQVSVPSGTNVILPQINDTIISGIEVLNVSKLDSLWLNNKQSLTLKQVYTVTSFDSALYYIPPFEVQHDTTIYKSNSLALQVLTIPVDTIHKDKFFGPKENMSLAYGWVDWKPVVYLIIAFIVLVILLILIYRSYRDNKPIIRMVKVEPKLPPHEQAINDLKKIIIPNESEAKVAKEYYTQVTGAVRVYLCERYSFNAMEMTSSEIIEELVSRCNKEQLDELRDLFGMADLVKFAKWLPEKRELSHHLDTACEFVDETKVEKSEDEKPEPTEVMVTEGRSKRTTYMLIAGMTVLAISAAGSLVYMLSIVYHLFR